MHTRVHVRSLLQVVRRKRAMVANSKHLLWVVRAMVDLVGCSRVIRLHSLSNRPKASFLLEVLRFTTQMRNKEVLHSLAPALQAVLTCLILRFKLFWSI